MFKRPPNQEGFTIVELLVVIIVIAILAAIVIVSYNGISSRAQDVATQTAVEQTTKQLYGWSSNNGVFPGYSETNALTSKTFGTVAYSHKDLVADSTTSDRAYISKSSFLDKFDTQLDGNVVYMALTKSTGTTNKDYFMSAVLAIFKDRNNIPNKNRIPQRTDLISVTNITGLYYLTNETDVSVENNALVCKNGGTPSTAFTAYSEITASTNPNISTPLLEANGSISFGALSLRMPQIGLTCGSQNAGYLYQLVHYGTPDNKYGYPAVYMLDGSKVTRDT